ncbi:MAG: agmatine deiminase family protein [Bdellovibrionales bacterium]|nr:agmatine deiminase family protein [Bdellovibrionales bacterium]
MIKHIILIAVAAFTSASVHAEVPRQGYSKAQVEEMVKHNQKIAANDILNQLTDIESLKMQAGALRVPYAEYNQAGYLIFNDRTDYNSWEAKSGMAKNLPEGVTLVVFTGNSAKSHHQQLKSKFSQFVESSRIKILFAPGGEGGFWARDAVPVPVFQAEGLSVVDARYYHNFEGDSYFANLFGATLTKHNYYYEGGNFLANSRGECIIVNKDQTSIMPDSVFTTKYGCASLIRLPHIKGIGHIDESVKFMNDTTVITDSEQYRDILDDHYTVVMIPRPAREYETYVNSLIINGTVYVPVFGQAGDQKALQIYQSFGLKTVALDSSTLSNQGLGSVHCITMTYPPVPLKEVAEMLNAVEVL